MRDNGPSTWAEVEDMVVSVVDVDSSVRDIQEFLAQNCLDFESTTKIANQQDALRDDLLGLGKINCETGAFIRSNWSAQKDGNWRLSPEWKRMIQPAHPDFNAEAYLAHFHANTTYDEMRGGRAVLKALMLRHSRDLQAIVKDNLHRVAPCELAIQDVREIVLGRQVSNRSGAAKMLENSFLETEALTQRLYGPLVERRLKTERLRRVLAVVEQHHYIFNLPRKLREGFDASENERIAEDFRRAKLWLGSQTDSRVTTKIYAEIMSAMGEFKDRQCQKLDDPNTSQDELESIIHVLEMLQPGVDHLLALVTGRKEKALEKLMKIRGLGAADVVLRQRLTPQVNVNPDQAKANVETVKDAVENATGIVNLLSSALRDGISYFWQLASLSVGKRDDKRVKAVQQMMNEILTEYAEAVSMTLLPRSFRGAQLISHESALQVRQTFGFAVDLGIELEYLGPLVSICSEVAESYAASVVRSMRNVAVELGSEFPQDFTTLAEQVRLLVSEALAEMEAVVLPEIQAARVAKQACVKTPMATAKALRGVCTSRDKNEKDDKLANKYLTIASNCYQLRVVSLAEIAEIVRSTFGGEGIDDFVTGAAIFVEKTELFFLDHFAKEAMIPFRLRVNRGIVLGNAVIKLQARPRAYAMELVLELSMCFATVRAATLTLPATEVCNPLVREIGKAFHESLEECKQVIRGAAADQCAFEIDFVEEALRKLQKANGDKGQANALIEITKAFAPAREYLHVVRARQNYQPDLKRALESVAFLLR